MEFAPFDPDGPLELEARLKLVPREGEAKGMFFTQILDAAKARSGGRPQSAREQYAAFKGYPYAEWLRVLPECARLAFPDAPAKEGMRRLGRDTYGTFFRSSIGKVVMGLASDFGTAVSLASRAYKVVGAVGTVTVVESRRGFAVVEMRRILDYPDAWHVGVFEGAMHAFHTEGEIEVRRHSLEDVDLRMRWA